MRKQLVFLLFVVMLSFAGCEDTPQLNLNTNQIELYSTDEHLITSDGTNVRFSSQNPYIAAVNETTGVVTARTIGETVIDVIADQGSATLKVVVKPRYSLYNEPCTDFSKTKDDIIAMFGEPDTETSTGIAYLYATDSSCIHISDMYLFESNKLSSSCALINESAALDLVKFLCERYIPVSMEGTTYYLVNGVDNESITKMVMVTKMTGYTVYQVIYAPYTNDTRALAPMSIEGSIPAEKLNIYAE